MCVCVRGTSEQTEKFYFVTCCVRTAEELLLCFSYFNSKGAQKADRAVPNEALYGVLRISRLITWTYLRSVEVFISLLRFTDMARG